MQRRDGPEKADNSPTHNFLHGWLHAPIVEHKLLKLGKVLFCRSPALVSMIPKDSDKTLTSFVSERRVASLEVMRYVVMGLGSHKL
jgi:hypothetical protein